MRQIYLAVILTYAASSIAAAANQTYLTDAIKNPSYLRSLTSLLEQRRQAAELDPAGSEDLRRLRRHPGRLFER